MATQSELTPVRLNSYGSELSKILSSSTLVETVSLNYEDFTEGFLTCGTCLYTYDGDEHSPKLLPCSHTLCRICLIRIASAAGVEDPLDIGGTFRCPICREMIQLPRGGVSGLPPSFLVNQLLDLMASQRREVVPKCSQHVNQELLYCESCDFVFCSLCTGGKHGKLSNSNSSSPTSPTKNNNCEHTVIPFSIAIKRMSEILLYKGQQCVGKLNESAQNVLNEMEMLDRNSDHAVEDINRTFQEIIGAVERRRLEMLAQAQRIREEKRQALREQLTSIENEKSHLERECLGFKRQVEVRNISKKINDLKEKLESIETMLDPKENCFLRFEHDQAEALAKIDDCLKTCTGNIRTSRTFPAACRAYCIDSSCLTAHLRCSVRVVTYDYNGEAQCFGGDPLTASLVNIDTADQNIPCMIIDNRDGTYSIDFIPPTPGTHSMKILIFGRSIKNFPLEFEVSEHINPIAIYGTTGNGEHQFNQPTALAFDPQGALFVLDTGNNRIKKLLTSPESLHFKLEDHFIVDTNSASTGLAFCGRSRSLLVTNWRDRRVKIFDCSGQQVKTISHPDMREPTCVAVGSSGQFAVADNGAGAVFVFFPSGKFNFKIEKQKTTFEFVTGLAFHPESGDLIVSDSRMFVFDKSGGYIRELSKETTPIRNKRVHYSGIAFDSFGQNLLATKVEGPRSVIHVLDYGTGTLKFVIDSFDSKIKRPGSLATIDDHVLLVDLGNDCIKKFRFC